MFDLIFSVLNIIFLLFSLQVFHARRFLRFDALHARACTIMNDCFGGRRGLSFFLSRCRQRANKREANTKNNRRSNEIYDKQCP